ncbi:MAG: ABC transporter permease [Gemmatimonadetes bacterium]|nr:ABC transporter permease [Gemmatimonadota bacterium]
MESPRFRALSQGLYRLALRCYPAAFRAAYGTGMLQTFAERRRDVAWARVPVFLLRELVSVAATGLRFRLTTAPGHAPPPPAKRKSGVLFGARLDLEFAFRTLGRNPGFTLVTVLTLALGIGANTAIFTIVNSVLLRPLGYEEPDRLVTLWETRRAVMFGVPSYPNFVDWRDQADGFEEMAFARARVLQRKTPEGAERLVAALVTEDFFSVLQGRTALGRTFVPEEEQPGAAHAMVLAYGHWVRRFGADPAVIGETLDFENGAYTVVGVMDSSFGYLTEWADGWTPFAAHLSSEQGVLNRDYRADNRVIARLNPGVRMPQAQAQLDAIATRLAAAYPASNTDTGIQMTLLRDRILGDVRPGLLVLMAAVGMVLLIACANVANLVLARVIGRTREFAVRGALGAGTTRLVRQLLTESLVLAAIGAILGFVLARVGIAYLAASPPGNLPRAFEIRLDLTVLAFTAGVTVVTTLLFGLVPAMQAVCSDLATALKDGIHGSAGRRRERLRSGFIVSQIAIASLLLIGAGLLLESFQQLRRVDGGFNRDHLLVLQIDPPRSRYDDATRRSNLYDRMRDAVGGLPGVSSAAVVSHQPLVGGWIPTPLEIPGRTDTSELWAVFRPASLDYFATMEIPVVRGRDFQAGDMYPSSPALIVNQRLADLLWPENDPLGQPLTIFKQNPDAPDYGEPIAGSVVGVVGNVRLRLADGRNVPIVYLPQDVHPWRTSALVARVEHETPETMAAVRRTVLAIDGDMEVGRLSSMDNMVLDRLSRERFLTNLVGAFAFAALLLAGVGIYSVISYVVSQRTGEIGIRMALGARSGDVLKLVLGRGFMLAVLGAGVGLVAALGLTRLMGSLLFGVDPADPMTFGRVTGVLLLVALVATLVPARRAAKVAPIIALRQD